MRAGPFYVDLIFHVKPGVASYFAAITVVEAELIVKVVEIAPHPAGFHVDSKHAVRTHVTRDDDELFTLRVKLASLCFVDLFHCGVLLCFCEYIIAYWNEIVKLRLC